MGEPPSLAGAAQVTDVVVLVLEAERPVGASGSVAGIMLADVDVTEVPVAFDATVVNEYAVPFVSPEMMQPVDGAKIVQLAPPGAAVTTYVVGSPPCNERATVTVTAPSCGCNVGASGAAGAEMRHCAVKVTFVAAMRYEAPALDVDVPLNQPRKSKPGFDGAAARVNDEALAWRALCGVAEVAPAVL